MAFYISYRHRVCLVDYVDLICNLYSWWGGFWSFLLAMLPLGFNWDFISTSAGGSSTGDCSWGCPGGLEFCPCEGRVWRWCRCLGLRGSGSTRYSAELAARTAGNTALQKGMAASVGLYTPVFLPAEPPSLNEKPGRPLSTRSQSPDMTEVTLHT